MTAVVHLVCGGTGAGKSTYARALAAREQALVFILDQWMTTLFWPDAPADLGNWAHERVERCTAQIRAVAGAATALGMPVVIDAGFATRADRALFGDWAAGRSLACRLRGLDLEPAARWRRVAARHAQGGGDTGIMVTPEMFAYMEALWQAPTSEEMTRLHGRRIEQAREGAGDGG
ncbi:MAG: AAA family ATPase [Pseudomonadota bacterium]